MFQTLSKGSPFIVIEGMGVPEKVKGIANTYVSMNQDIVDYTNKSSDLYVKQGHILDTPIINDRYLDDMKSYINREKTVLIIGGVTVTSLIIATIMLYLKD